MPLRLNGSTSGYAEIKAPAVAGSTSLTLPTDSIQPGLVLVNETAFSAVSSVSVNNCFTSTYENYRMIVNMTAASTNLALRFRTRLAGSDDTGANYFRSAYYIGTTGAAAGTDVGGVLNYWTVFDACDSTDANNLHSLDLFSPLSGKRKNALGMYHQQNPSAVGYGGATYFNKIVTTNYDGLTFYTSTGTATFTVRIYGYRNSITA